MNLEDPRDASISEGPPFVGRIGGEGFRFPSTCWSWVVAAGQAGHPASREALEGLCRSYWRPIYALIRSRGYQPGDAADLTQDYFARLLDGRLLRAADPGKGRFRTLLRTDCGYFLSDEGDSRRTRKRGGQSRPVPFDVEREGERRGGLEAHAEDDPARLFDRSWALALLERTLENLARREFEAGRGEWFLRLRSALVDAPGGRPYAEIAAELDTTVGAVQAAVVRLRKRYRQALRDEIAATLGDPSPEAIDDEIRALREVVAR